MFGGDNVVEGIAHEEAVSKKAAASDKVKAALASVASTPDSEAVGARSVEASTISEGVIGASEVDAPAVSAIANLEPVELFRLPFCKKKRSYETI